MRKLLLVATALVCLLPASSSFAEDSAVPEEQSSDQQATCDDEKCKKSGVNFSYTQILRLCHAFVLAEHNDLVAQSAAVALRALPPDATTEDVDAAITAAIDFDNGVRATCGQLARPVPLLPSIPAPREEPADVLGDSGIET